MDNKEIHELIKLLSKTNLSELKIRKGDFELTLRTDTFHRGKFEVMPQVVSQPAAMAHSSQQPGPASSAAHPAPSSAPSDVKTESADKAPASNLLEVKSPMVGTFYRSPSPDKPVFVQVGDHIKAGDVVCIIEAMKLFNEIESEVSGKIVKVLTNDANPVEYDQVLFLVDPAG